MVHSEHTAWCTVNTLHGVQCPVHTLHGAQYTVHTLHTAQYTVHILHGAQCTVHTIPCTLQTMQSAVDMASDLSYGKRSPNGTGSLLTTKTFLCIMI